MSQLVRFSMSIPRELSERFDELVKNRGYQNRSEAVRDLIRSELVVEEWKDNKEVFGTITLVYDHHKRNLLNKITDLQHDYGHLIVSSSHVHVDHDNCLEVIIVKGPSNDLQTFADKLVGTKGVVAGELVRLTSGQNIE